MISIILLVYCGFLFLKMLLYHPYVFSFCYGLGFITTITGISISLGSLSMFGSSKVQSLILWTNVLQFVMAIFSRIITINTTFWIILVVVGSIYALLYTILPYFQCYNIMTPKARRIGHFGYPVVFIGLVVYSLGVYGFISNLLAVLIYLSTTPILFIFGSYQQMKISRMIKQHPLKVNDKNFEKQQRLLLISNYSIAISGFLAMCGFYTAVVGSFTENGALWDLCIGFQAGIVFVSTVSNVLFTANKFIQVEAKQKNETAIRTSVVTSVVTQANGIIRI